jgi:hypothetical protein
MIEGVCTSGVRSIYFEVEEGSFLTGLQNELPVVDTFSVWLVSLLFLGFELVKPPFFYFSISPLPSLEGSENKERQHTKHEHSSRAN